MTGGRSFSSRFAGFEREPARRVFASELRETRLQFKDGDDDKSPSYVLLPTGQRCNRILACGQMTQKDKRGDQNVFYTVRVADPTGTFFVNAGSYQPEAMQQLSKLEPDSWIAVVGKPGIRETPDGAVFVSVRAETAVRIDEETYRLWVLDTAERTLERLEAYGIEGDSRRAKEFYGIDRDKFRQIVYDALTRIRI
jgi:RPA family protein